jgi:hypothetical protein
MPLGRRSGRIDAREQITQGAPSPQGEPDPAAVFGPVMEQVAPLAQRLRCGAAARSARGRGRDVPPPAPPWSSGPAAIWPGQGRGPRGHARRARPGELVPPATIAQVTHHLAVRPPAGLAAALGAHETDPAADLRPVDRIVVPELGLDRHSGERRGSPRQAPRPSRTSQGISYTVSAAAIPRREWHRTGSRPLASSSLAASKSSTTWPGRGDGA